LNYEPTLGLKETALLIVEKSPLHSLTARQAGLLRCGGSAGESTGTEGPVTTLLDSAKGF
jgi:hypothetical protein